MIRLSFSLAIVHTTPAPLAQSPCCHSGVIRHQSTWRGLTDIRVGLVTVQRYLCKACGRTFSAVVAKAFSRRPYGLWRRTHYGEVGHPTTSRCQPKLQKHSAQGCRRPSSGRKVARKPEAGLADSPEEQGELQGARRSHRPPSLATTEAERAYHIGWGLSAGVGYWRRG